MGHNFSGRRDMRHTISGTDASDGERALLLREMNHRSKNIMQTVAASLRMTARRSPNIEVKAALNGAAGRVTALAASHALLYRSGNGERVAVRSYLEDLCASLAAMWREEGMAVDIRVRGENPHWGEQTASWLGMTTLEAVMNSLRHGFDGQASAAVSIHLLCNGDRWLLRVEDSGHGYDAASARRGLGSDLMTAFSGYLGGTLAVQSRPGAGTVVLLDFPDPA